MLFLLFSITASIALYYVVPLIIKNFSGRSPKSSLLLAAACIIYFLSWYLPSPLIHGQDTDFSTHFIGGGIFSGLIWLYVKNHVQWKSNWLFDLFTLFALVSALGVANELAELTINELGILPINTIDTSWDLIANTLGAIVFWLGYIFTNSFNSSSKN